MKKLLITLMTALLPFGLRAQSDAQAAEILDKVLTELTNTSGIRLEFGGTENGILLLKGEKFYLNNGNIQSWFDGKNQWSYVGDTEEVNISHPSNEELQGLNPYFISPRITGLEREIEIFSRSTLVADVIQAIFDQSGNSDLYFASLNQTVKSTVTFKKYFLPELNA